jgi:hypothetical protein
MSARSEDRRPPRSPRSAGSRTARVDPAGNGRSRPSTSGSSGSAAIDNKIELFKTKLEGRLAGGPHLLRRLFFHLDVDRSGKVDEKELSNIMHNFNIEHTPAQVSAIMNRFDSDGSGDMDLQE